LANRVTKYPYGVVEDVLVKVDKLTIHVDFVIMDMKEDEEVPLILGRPFMKTAKVIVDVDKGELQLRARDEEVTFSLFYGLKIFNAGEEFVQMNVTKGVIHLEINFHNEEEFEQKNFHTYLTTWLSFCPVAIVFELITVFSNPKIINKSVTSKMCNLKINSHH